jgi:hypothetical protein
MLHQVKVILPVITYPKTIGASVFRPLIKTTRRLTRVPLPAAATAGAAAGFSSLI